MRTFIRHISIPFCWAVVVFVLHTIPGSDLAYDDPWRILKLDKIIHFSMFAILVITLVIAFRKQSLSGFLHANEKKASVIFALCYAAILEYYQGKLVVMRATDPLDFVADCVGALSGILLFRLIYGRALFKLN